MHAMPASDTTRQEPGAIWQSLTAFDFETVNPCRGAKYSPNLYNFLAHKRRRYFSLRARVFATSGGHRWLGYFDDTEMFTGARLSQILTYGAKTQLCCVVNLGLLSEVVDFWAEYQADGRCAIDRPHTTVYLNDASRWALGDSVRKCLWCNKASQRLTRHIETVEHMRWENLPVTSL